jgi:HEAT repeat protein
MPALDKGSLDIKLALVRMRVFFLPYLSYLSSGTSETRSPNKKHMRDIQTYINALTSGDDQRAEAAVKELSRIGRAAFPAVVELLDSPKADTRWWATWALASFDLPEIPGLLYGLIKDPDLSVRQCAVLALRVRPTPQAIPDLIELLSDQDSVLVRLAGAALTALGKESVPALLDLVQEGNQKARLEAVRTLAMIGDQRAIATLFEVSQEDSAVIEYWANEGLERLGIGMVFFNP